MTPEEQAALISTTRWLLTVVLVVVAWSIGMFNQDTAAGLLIGLLVPGQDIAKVMGWTTAKAYPRE